MTVRITCSVDRGAGPGHYDYVHIAYGGVSCGTLAVLHPGGQLVAERLSSSVRDAFERRLRACADAVSDACEEPAPDDLYALAREMSKT
jgi:hypothetical protein